MIKKTLIAFSFLLSTSAMAEDANLSYSYVDLGANIGQFTLKTAGRKFEYKAITYNGTLSYQLDNNYFLAIDVITTNIDDRDKDNGVILDLDGKMQSLAGKIGYASPITDSSDVVFQIGAEHAKDDLAGRFIPGSDYKYDKNKTNLLWEIGLRSLWEEHAFEGNISVFGADGGIGFHIGGPMYITENVALDLHYTYAVKDESKLKSNISSIGLNLRTYF